MPTWTDTDQRQYSHIRDQLQRQGSSPARAREIAARATNKRRRREGRTPNRTTQGTGNPRQRLEKRTRDELYNLARQLDIAGRGRMKKSELIRGVRERR